MKRLIYISIIVCGLLSCKQATETIAFQSNENDCAQFFQIIEHDTTSATGDVCHFQELIIFNPWETAQVVMSRFYLTADAQTPIPEEQLRLQIPLKHVTTGSCTHIGFIHELETMDHVCGVTDRALIYTSIPEGLTDLGDGMKPNVELLMQLKPDVVFVSAYSSADATSEQLKKVGLTTIPVVEWMESTPLARAEWIRFFGVLLGKEQQADSIYDKVASHYRTLQQTIGQSALYRTKTIMSGSNFRGTWYVPSGSNYMGRLFIDAGASYAYANDSTAGSLPLSTEQVLHTFKDADAWVGAPTSTLAELTEIDEKHSWFKSYTNGEVFHFSARTTPTGGNDFWESGITRPDLILEDLIHVLYPTIEPDYQFVYTGKLK